MRQTAEEENASTGQGLVNPLLAPEGDAKSGTKRLDGMQLETLEEGSEESDEEYEELLMKTTLRNKVDMLGWQ